MHERRLAGIAFAACLVVGGCKDGDAPVAGQKQGDQQQAVEAGQDAATGVEAPVTQAPGTQAPGTAVPVTQAPVAQAPVAPAPVAQAPAPARVEPKPKTTEPVSHRSETKAPEAPRSVTLAVGTVLSGTLQTTVSSDKNHVGDVVQLRTDEAVKFGGRTVVPVGSIVHGTVTHVQSAGRFKGAAELTVRFTELEVQGSRVAITCEPLRRVIKGDGKETAAEIGGAAAVGGVLGGVIGKDKEDVLKGTAIGAAVGTGVAAVTKGDQIVLDAGKAISLTLTAPTSLTVGPPS